MQEIHFEINPPKFYKSLSSRIIGYAKVTSLEIMTHLISEYAKLEEEDLVRTHKHEVHLFNEYHAVDRACKKVILKLTPQKFYKSLSSRIIGFTKVTSLEIRRT